MKVYIKNEVYFNRKPNVIDDYLSIQYPKFSKDYGVYMVDVEKISELCELVKGVIKVLNVPNIYPFITPVGNILTITLRQMDRNTMKFK